MTTTTEPSMLVVNGDEALADEINAQLNAMRAQLAEVTAERDELRRQNGELRARLTPCVACRARDGHKPDCSQRGRDAATLRAERDELAKAPQWSREAAEEQAARDAAVCEAAAELLASLEHCDGDDDVDGIADAACGARATHAEIRDAAYGCEAHCYANRTAKMPRLHYDAAATKLDAALAARKAGR